MPQIFKKGTSQIWTAAMLVAITTYYSCASALNLACDHFVRLKSSDQVQNNPGKKRTKILLPFLVMFITCATLQKNFTNIWHLYSYNLRIHLKHLSKQLKGRMKKNCTYILWNLKEFAPKFSNNNFLLLWKWAPWIPVEKDIYYRR